MEKNIKKFNIILTEFPPYRDILADIKTKKTLKRTGITKKILVILKMRKFKLKK